MSQSSVTRALVAGAMIAAFSDRVVAQTGPGHWVNISPEGGTVLTLAVDPRSPSTIYAGCNSGIFKGVKARRAGLPPAFSDRRSWRSFSIRAGR
jgi:hypothetical protein